MTNASGIPTMACVVILMNEERNFQAASSLSIGLTRVWKLMWRVVNERQISREEVGRKKKASAWP